MEWYEGEDRAVFKDTAKRYAAWALKHFNVEELDARVTPESFDREMIVEGAKAGLISAVLAEEVGGAGLDTQGELLVVESMAKGLASAAALFALHWSCLGAISSVGAKNSGLWLLEFSEKALDNNPLICGTAIPAPVVDNKSSFGKEFICPLHPALCDRIIIPLIDDDGEYSLMWADGTSMSEYCTDMFPGSGFFETPFARLVVSGELPAEELVSGGPAQGIASGLKSGLYLGYAVSMVGNADAAMTYAWEYAKERVQTGRPIIAHQEVRRMLEEMKTQVEAARAMVYTAAVSGDDMLDRARRAYTFSGTVCERVCLDAIQVLGGYGYMEDYGIERRLRDHKTMQCMFGGHAMELVGKNI
jgi:alkylation response protein AidB-like acyl-CoA dehydrogenase